MAKRRNYKNNKNNGKVLITILAILFFPISITIWIIKSSLSQKTKIILLLSMWVGLPVLGMIVDLFTPDIKSISHEETASIIVVANKESETETIIVETTKENVVTDESVVLIIDDPSIAKVIERENSKDGIITYKVTGLSAGSTYIHAETAKGKHLSDKREIAVRNPIPVKNVIISGATPTIPIGDKAKLISSAEPSDADIDSYHWSTSDDSIISIDDDGNITANGKGTATITATINDVSSSVDISVDTSIRTMHVKARGSRTDNNNIGDQWTQSYEINGEGFGSGSKAYTLNVGDELQFFAKITEDDDNPDVGTASAYHVVTENDLLEGFEINMDVYVTENGGQNRGLSAHYDVTFTFEP